MPRNKLSPLDIKVREDISNNRQPPLTLVSGG